MVEAKRRSKGGLQSRVKDLSKDLEVGTLPIPRKRGSSNKAANTRANGVGNQPQAVLCRIRQRLPQRTLRISALQWPDRSKPVSGPQSTTECTAVVSCRPPLSTSLGPSSCKTRKHLPAQWQHDADCYHDDLSPQVFVVERQIISAIILCADRQAGYRQHHPHGNTDTSLAGISTVLLWTGR
jgi:hypothetical protein